jgi:DNA-binding transcriptional ArsR family regulator
MTPHTINHTIDNLRRGNTFNHMVDNQEARLDIVFRALGDRTRRHMLQRLSRGEHTVSELAEPYDISLAAASKHIQSLERAGLVRRTVRGRIHYVRIDPRPLERADDWLRAYEKLWDTRIERLIELLRHPDNPTQAE